MPESYALVSLDEARTQLGIEDTNKAARVSLLVDAATELIENYIGNAVVIRSFTEKHWGAKKHIFLQRYPVTAITSITDPDSQTVAAADYILIDDEGRLQHHGTFPNARDADGARARWSIVYTAGRYTATNTVAAKFKEAAHIIIAERFRRAEPGITSRKVGDLAITYSDRSTSRSIGRSLAIPDEVRALLADEVSLSV